MKRYKSGYYLNTVTCVLYLQQYVGEKHNWLSRVVGAKDYDWLPKDLAHVNDEAVVYVGTDFKQAYELWQKQKKSLKKDALSRLLKLQNLPM